LSFLDGRRPSDGDEWRRSGLSVARTPLPLGALDLDACGGVAKASAMCSSSWSGAAAVMPNAAVPTGERGVAGSWMP